MSIADHSQTVEEYLKARCNALASDLIDYGDMLADKLQTDFEAGKQELLDVHEHCLAGVLDPSTTHASHASPSASTSNAMIDDKENFSSNSHSSSSMEGPSKRTKTEPSTISATTSTASKRRAPTTSLHVRVEGGPHDGVKAVLHPKVGKTTACFIGRSTGKKFTDKGMSLSKDLEVSTTHGKWELMKDGKIYFTDTGSTNGTFVGDKQLVEGEPLEIKDGSRIRCGASVLLMTITKE